MSKRILSLVLAVVLAVGCSVGVSAATTYGVFEGYTVVVTNTTTPAIGIVGRAAADGSPGLSFYFLAADGASLGHISEAAYKGIIEKYHAVDTSTGGTAWVAPDYDGDWKVWFAENFNIYRGLSVGAGVIAAAESEAATIEQYRQEVIRLVNIERENIGLEPYIISDVCMEYSQVRAVEINELFSHTRPDGTGAGYEVCAAGQGTPEQAVAAWMNSDGHRAAILNENRVYVGAGVYKPDGLSGYYWQMYFAMNETECSYRLQ